MIQYLHTNQYLAGNSVRSINSGYNQYIAELYEHYSLIEKNCLHVIYERLRICDEILSDFEQCFLDALQRGVIKEPYKAYAERLQDIYDNYTVIEELIKSFLSGTPKDVFPKVE